MKRIFPIIFGIVLILVDQLSKYTIRSSGGFYICNKNIAFGLNIYPILFWIFWLLVTVMLLYQIHRYNYEMRPSICYVLILAGALSNVIDRFHFGCVIDFIDLRIWPVFNLADSFIVIGAVLVLFKLIKK